MLDMGAVLAADRPTEFAAFIAGDYAKWQKVIQEAGSKWSELFGQVEA